MGRPRAVNLKTFPLYDKLHTEKVKMYSGVEMTALYPIKETEHFYRSIEVWASSASQFKHKKKEFNLEVNIPILTDAETIKLLEENAWDDWVAREMKDEDEKGEMTEAIGMLKKLFPDKEPVFFHELSNLMVAYNQGTFISYDRETGEVKEPSETTLRRRKSYNRTYNPRFSEAEECVKMRERWTSQTDEALKAQYLTEYANFERDYLYEHNNLMKQFIEIGKNAVCYPVAFSENTAEWSKEKYGKLIAYAHAGEIYFVATADKVYFEITRHF